MRRRGFTVVEMMIALSISMLMLAAFGGFLTSVWMLARESTDEVECALHACALRQRLFHRLTDKDGKPLDVGGLANATNILCCAGDSRIVAGFLSGDPWSVDLKKESAAVRYFGLDASKCSARDYRTAASKGHGSKPPSLQYVYLAISGQGGTVYYDRMIVPIVGRSPSKEEFEETVGVK